MRTRQQVIDEELRKEFDAAVATLKPNQKELLAKIQKSYDDAPEWSRESKAGHFNALYDLVHRTVVKNAK